MSENGSFTMRHPGLSLVYHKEQPFVYHMYYACILYTIYMFMYANIYRSSYLASVCLCIDLSVHLPIYLSTYLNLPTYLPTRLSIYLSMYLCICIRSSVCYLPTYTCRVRYLCLCKNQYEYLSKIYTHKYTYTYV